MAPLTRNRAGEGNMAQGMKVEFFLHREGHENLFLRVPMPVCKRIVFNYLIQPLNFN